MPAAPARVCAAYSCALARGSPQATPPSAIASMNWYTKAGPQPDTALAASISRSSRASNRPAPAILSQNSSTSASVTCSLAA